MAGTQKIPEDVYEEAAEMLADGLTYENVATYLGISQTALRYKLDPVYKEKIRKGIAKWRAKNRIENLYKQRYDHFLH